MSDQPVSVAGERLLACLAASLLVLSAATVTVAYYQVHGPALHAIILLALLWSVLRLRRGVPRLIDRDTALLSGLFLLYALVAVLSAARVGFNTAALDRLDHFSYFLAGAFLIPFLIRVRPRPVWFWLAVASTALLSGLYALWEVQTFSEAFELATGREYRAGGSKGKQIPFGDIAMLTAVLSLLAASRYAGSWPFRATLFGLAAGSGVYASLASGTRGAWVFLPVALAVIGLQLLQQYPAYRRVILVGILGLALGGAVLVSQSEQIQSRISTAVSEIQAYTAGRGVGPGNSMGERFEMWRAAWMAYREQPLLGIGVGQLNAYFKQAAERGSVSEAIVAFDEGNGHTHAHNDYLHALGTRGLLGLVSLLLLYLVPLAVFIRAAATSQGREARTLGYAGILLLLGYMQFSLTDSILLMRITAGFFVLLCCWLLAMVLGRSADGWPDEEKRPVSMPT